MIVFNVARLMVGGCASQRQQNAEGPLTYPFATYHRCFYLSSEIYAIRVKVCALAHHTSHHGNNHMENVRVKCWWSECAWFWCYKKILNEIWYRVVCDFIWMCDGWFVFFWSTASCNECCARHVLVIPCKCERSFRNGVDGRTVINSWPAPIYARYCELWSGVMQ